MTNISRQSTSCLFTVRLWVEEFDRQLEWRGQIHLVSSGERHYFRDWPTLVSLLERLLRCADSAASSVMELRRATHETN